MKYLAIIPGSKMINGSYIDVVDHVENKGVLLKSSIGKIIAFIKVECNEEAAHYALELSKFAMACAKKQNYEMNFEWPVKQASSK